MPSLSRTTQTTVPRAVVPQRQLRDAVANGELELHYQPIIDLGTGRIRGAEALLRWHVAGGMLMPDDFLPAVAHTPAMRELTSWVLDAACAQASRWPSWTVSVPASSRCWSASSPRMNSWSMGSEFVTMNRTVDPLGTSRRGGEKCE